VPKLVREQLCHRVLRDKRPSSGDVTAARRGVLLEALSQKASLPHVLHPLRLRVLLFQKASSEDGRGEDTRDRQFENHLNNYYDEVIAFIRDADSILVFGPGEAKGEFEKRTAHEGVKVPITVETVDKMTDGQISVKVREHFQKK
jgi:stalled ribosome rescue protein Dom34